MQSGTSGFDARLSFCFVHNNLESLFLIVLFSQIKLIKWAYEMRGYKLYRTTIISEHDEFLHFLVA